jgi:hypothetical protein
MITKRRRAVTGCDGPDPGFGPVLFPLTEINARTGGGAHRFDVF